MPPESPGVVTIEAAATDDVGVTDVTFLADGKSLGVSGVRPYSMRWDTTQVTNGTHQVTATARDAAGHTATASVQVTVANANGLQAPATGFFYHPDHLGSSTLITDAAGKVVQRLRYLPFGGFAAGTGPTDGVAVQHYFTGKEWDAETELYEFGARSYDPQLGRFTQPDPVVSLYDPQSFNPYTYVRNNPLRLVDPDGRSWQTSWSSYSVSNFGWTGTLGSWFGGFGGSLNLGATFSMQLFTPVISLPAFAIPTIPSPLPYPLPGPQMPRLPGPSPWPGPTPFPLPGRLPGGGGWDERNSAAGIPGGDAGSSVPVVPFGEPNFMLGSNGLGTLTPQSWSKQSRTMIIDATAFFGDLFTLSTIPEVVVPGYVIGGGASLIGTWDTFNDWKKGNATSFDMVMSSSTTGIGFFPGIISPIASGIQWIYDFIKSF